MAFLPFQGKRPRGVISLLLTMSGTSTLQATVAQVVESQDFYKRLAMNEGNPFIRLRTGSEDDEDMDVKPLCQSDAWKDAGYITQYCRAVMPEDRERFMAAVLRVSDRNKAFFFVLSVLSPSSGVPSDFRQQVASVVKDWREFRPDLEREYPAVMANLYAMAAPDKDELICPTLDNPCFVQEVERGNISTDTLRKLVEMRRDTTDARATIPPGAEGMMRLVQGLSDERWDSFPYELRVLAVLWAYGLGPSQGNTSAGFRLPVVGDAAESRRAREVIVQSLRQPGDNVERLTENLEYVSFLYVLLRDRDLRLSQKDMEKIKHMYAGRGCGQRHGEMSFLGLIPPEDRETELQFFHEAALRAGVRIVNGIGSMVSETFSFLPVPETPDKAAAMLEEIGFQAFHYRFPHLAVAVQMHARLDEYRAESMWTKLYTTVLERTDWNLPDSYAEVWTQSSDMMNTENPREECAPIADILSYSVEDPAPVLRSMIGGCIIGSWASELEHEDIVRTVGPDSHHLYGHPNLPPREFWAGMVEKHHPSVNEQAALQLEAGPMGVNLQAFADWYGLQRAPDHLDPSPEDARHFLDAVVSCMRIVHGGRRKAGSWGEYVVRSLPHIPKDDWSMLKERFPKVFAVKDRNRVGDNVSVYSGASWQRLMSKYRTRRYKDELNQSRANRVKQTPTSKLEDVEFLPF